MSSTKSDRTEERKARPRTWTVVVVDDHPIVRRGIRDALEDETSLEVVREVSDEAGAVSAVRELTPDLVTVDISLGHGSGLGLIKQLRSEFPNLGILVVSVHDEEIYAERALRAGADGYFRKCGTASELVEAIRTVLEGGTALTQSMTERLVHQAVRGRQGEPSGVESLSDRELEVFQMIGAGLSTRKIAAQLCISIKTVETHRENIKHKLEIGNAPELARFAVAWVENPA
ncbi:MAG: response regulator [Phycisphaerales bacterium JB040]